MSEEIIKKVLKNLELTEKEAEVYIFLSKHGVLKCGEIAKGMKRHKAQIYRILRILQTKGLLESTLESPTRFTAVPFEAVLDLSIKAKRDEAAQMEKTRKEILTYWKSISQPGLEPALGKFVVIEGNQKIYLKITQMIKQTKKQLSAVATVSGLARADQFGIFDAIINHPLGSKIQFRFLTDLSSQNLNTMKTVLKAIPDIGFNLKGRTPDLGLRSPRMVIRDEEESLFFITPGSNAPTTEQDVCLWTDSKELVHSFSAVFEDFWQNSTDIEQKITEIESDSISKRIFISNAEEAEKTYNELMSSAKKRILMLTSSQGLMTLCKNNALTKEWRKKAISIKIMAPITSKNLEDALQLSTHCPVRHVPFGYLETILIDEKHVFQINPSLQEKGSPEATRHFENTFYSSDPEYAKRIKFMLNGIWKGASTPSNVNLNSEPSPLPTVGAPDEVAAFGEMWKMTPSALPTGRATVGSATIYPTNRLNNPAIKIEIYHHEKESAYGEGNALFVYLRLKTPKGYAFVPVAAVETNKNAVIPQKALFAGTPATENFQLVKPCEFQVCRQGNTLFAGWTVQIPLPPTTQCLPPACMLFEAYGEARHIVKSEPVSSGHIVTWISDIFDTFVTFLDPSWKYAGPGTQGLMTTNATFAISLPKTGKTPTV